MVKSTQLSPDEAQDLVRRLGASDLAERSEDPAGAWEALEGVTPAQAARPEYRAQRASLLARHIADPGKLAEAERLFRKLLNDGAASLGVYVNFGNLLKVQGKFDQAEKTLMKALRAEPRNPAILSNLGSLYQQTGQWARAEQMLRETLKLSPGNLPAASGLGYIRLGLGDVEEGWPLYNYRLGLKSALGASPLVPEGLTVWDGADPVPASALIWREQGVGEEILFGSLAPELAARGVRVGLIADKRLASLFDRSFDGVEVFADAEESRGRISAFETHGPIGALGRAVRPTPASFPSPPPARLKADPARRAEMRAWLDSLGPGLKVGMAWRSSLTRSATKKTVPLSEWGPILKIPGVTYVDLQYGPTDEDRALALGKHKVKIACHPTLDRKDDLEGLSALIAELDAVATTSNVTAHFAGGLGQTTFQMLPNAPVWYWGYDRLDHSRWYPNIRIVRRADPGLDAKGWGPTVRALAKELSAWVETRR